jgi:hypothetical protein
MQDGRWAPRGFPRIDERGPLVWISVAARRVEIERQNFLGLEWPAVEWHEADGEEMDRTLQFLLAEGLCFSVVCI